LHPKRDPGASKASEGRAADSTNNVGEGLPASHSLESLSIYLREALEVNGAYEPPGHGRPYRSPMWEFVRRAKRHPQLRKLPGFEAANIVERVIYGWFGSIRSVDPWQSLFPESEDPKVEFIYTWPRIKWAASVLELAQEEAAHLALEPLECCSPQYARFVSIVGHLQRNVDGAIVVPCTKFAQILGCSAMAVSRYRSLAIDAGILRMQCRGIRQQRKADEFTFAVEKFDWTTGKQITSENLNLWLTSSTKCYTEIQENHEIERKEESQEQQEGKEIQEMHRETRAPISVEGKKCAIKQGPYIPTTAELAEELKRTARFSTH
jgi:hypothetical protein